MIAALIGPIRALGIQWPIAPHAAVLSDKDRKLPDAQRSADLFRLTDQRSYPCVYSSLVGAGFIGSAVCRQLVGTHGVHVVNVDKLTYAANLSSLNDIADDPRYAFERADVCDRPAMDAIFARYQPTAVLHLAAESHVDRSITSAARFYRY